VRISQWFDRIGADANAATTKEYTTVYARVLDKHVAGALDVFGEMVLQPSLTDDDLRSEREVVLEEIAMYEDSPSDIAHELADRIVFGDHPLGVPIIGSTPTISGVTSSDLTRFHSVAYGRSRMVVTAAGNVDHDQFVQQVSSSFLQQASHGESSGRRGLNSSGTEPGLVLQDRALSPASQDRVARVVHKDTEQVHVCLAGPGIHRMDDRRFAALILDTILGGTSSSRLFHEVREKRGLAYSVYSYLGRFADAGIAGVNVAVRPDRVRTTLRVIRKELDRMLVDGPTADELERAKEHVEGRTVLSMESVAARGNRLGGALVAGLPIQSVAEILGRIDAVTRDDVQAMAQELFDPTRLSCAVVAQDVETVRGDIEAELGLTIEQAPVPTAVAG
jgi:predicted Zn-dependent peptidase